LEGTFYIVTLGRYFIALPVLFSIKRTFRFIYTDHQLRLLPASQLRLAQPYVCHVKNISLKIKCRKAGSISRKLEGSILEEVLDFIFSLPNLSSHTMVLGSTKSNRNEYQESHWGVERSWRVRLTI
jgi:hypothetical protein